MSTADLFVEAIDTVITLGWALAGWLIFLAVVVTMLALAAIVTGAWGVNAVRGWLRGPVAASDGPEVPREPQPAHSASQAPPRRTPSWARTDHHTYDEAA
jgi:hypothetical protein